MFRLVHQVRIPPSRTPPVRVVHDGVAVEFTGNVIRFVPVIKKEREDCLKKKIESLTKVDKSEIDKERDEDCPICLSNFNECEETDIICRLKCNHIIHQICIHKWIESSKKNQCPMCRGKAI